MSPDWGESFVRDKSSLVLWGATTLIAIMRYLYEARCGRRRRRQVEEEPVATEAQIQHNEAKERLLRQLDEKAGPFKPVNTKDEEEAVGDIEEVEKSEIIAFSNACAICLEEFEEGDKVVRSVATKGCPHIFHDGCMKEMIAASTKKGTYSIPCPCCRQTFVETGSDTSA